MKDQGHRKGGSFPVFLLFLCKPLFRRATLPNGGREQSRAVVDVEESVVEVSGDNVRGGGRNVEGNVSMKEFLESCLEVIFEAEKELAVSGGDFEFGRGSG